MENVNYINEQNTNAAVAAAEVNATFQSASATSPAGFAVNGSTAAVEPNTDFHKLEIALSQAKLVDATEKLIQRRKDWEAGALKASNVLQLGLLSDCLALRLHIMKYDDARINFNQLYKTSGFDSTKATSSTTKVVRYVFGGKSKQREFAYAKALTIAVEVGVQPEDFAKFVEDNGGLEELRRNGVNAGKKRQERDTKIKNTAAVLKTSTPIVQHLPAPQGLTLEGSTNFVAAIMRKESDGTLSVVHVSANEALVSTLLEHASKSVSKAAETDDYVNGRSNAANPTNNQ